MKLFNVDLELHASAVVMAEDEVDAQDVDTDEIIRYEGESFITATEIKSIKDVPMDWLKQIPYEAKVTCEEFFASSEEERMKKEAFEYRDKNQLKFPFDND